MLRIQRNSDGSLRTNRTSHTADLLCDQCGTTASGVDMNANGIYSTDSHGTHKAINLTCAQIGGSCMGGTCWPTANGNADSVEMALVKTA